MNYQGIAKEIVLNYANKHIDKTDNVQIRLDDVFIVWFCKTLQNWKALVSTSLPDGMYYEVTYALNNSILNGQAELNRNVMQGNFDLQKTMMQGDWGIGQQLNDNRFAQQQCCCETNRNIDSVRADAYQNTCKITTAIHEEAEKTRGMIAANTMQELRDKLADRDRDLQTARFNLSQFAQTAAVVNQIRPYPQPAYITSSPYQSMGYGTCNGVVV